MQCQVKFLSTLSLRRATRNFITLPVLFWISIHALLAESDVVRVCEFVWGVSISIHALLAESDGPAGGRTNSTPDFYPRSPCGERLVKMSIKFFNADFYPRSPCGERLKNPEAVSKYMIFLSTLSLRRATGIIPVNIMLHFDFYPRSPCGERQLCNLLLTNIGHFYPRSPCGERHLQHLLCEANSCISIHALLAESDVRK